MRHDLSFMSLGATMSNVQAILRTVHPDSIPSHVISLMSNKEYFCSSLIVAGIILQELGQGKIVTNPEHIPFGNFPVRTFRSQEIQLCSMRPFYPATYIAEPGLLELILQSGDEALFMMRDLPDKKGWAVFWDWANVFPEQEFLFYP